MDQRDGSDWTWLHAISQFPNTWPRNRVSLRSSATVVWSSIASSKAECTSHGSRPMEPNLGKGTVPASREESGSSMNWAGNYRRHHQRGRSGPQASDKMRRPTQPSARMQTQAKYRSFQAQGQSCESTLHSREQDTTSPTPSHKLLTVIAGAVGVQMQDGMASHSDSCSMCL